MKLDTGMSDVYALSLLTAESPLRERQVLMLQQTLHNARVAPEERLRLLTRYTGRSILSLREVHQGELRPILKQLQSGTAHPSR
jgi:hypothetical protein